MATLNKNITQAIHDFNSIQTAIIDKDVDIPEGTPTEAYGDKIREIETGITPAGILEITENGSYDVAQYAEADVNVEGITIDESYDISEGTLRKIVPTVTGDYILTVPNGITTINNRVFQSEQGNMTITPLIITKLIMSNTVTEILGGAPWAGGGAFQECYRLNEIVFSNSLETIGNYCFAACTALTSISIPDSVTNIGDSAFQNCTALTSIIISDSVTSIGAGAFSGCENLTDIYYTGTQQQWEAITGISDAGIPETATIHYEYTPEQL